ncbi:MAG: ArsR/SmtB family transcription factor [Erysipelotrichaceae bacterium]
MSLHIQSQINPLYEWVSAGFYLQNQKELESQLEKNFASLQSVDQGETKRCFHGIWDALMLCFPFDPQTHAFWFGPLREVPFEENCLAFLFGFMTPSNLHMFIEEVRTTQDDDLQQSLCERVSEHLDFEPLQTTLGGVMEALDQDADFSQQGKWHVALLLQLGKKKLLPFLEEMQRQQPRVQAIYAEYQKEVGAFVSQLQTWNQDATFLKTHIGIELDPQEEWTIYPSLFRFNSLSMQQSLIAPASSQLYFGWKVTTLMALATVREDEVSALLPQLKAIADRSKLELLHLLSHQRMYGSQLAEKMQLSGATISYHMNQLVLAKLVVIQKVENRIYYEVNATEMQTLLDHLHAFLLPNTKS